MRSSAYSASKGWKVILLPEVTFWLDELDQDDYENIIDSLKFLREIGPALGRPRVDRVKESQLHNLKELRPPSSNMRLLFIFDPRREAIVLCAGDKSGKWKSWYDENIVIAEERYRRYLNGGYKEEDFTPRSYDA
jgi:hypothetical protein